MKNIKNALKVVSAIGLIWSLRVVSMDVTSSAPGTPAKKPAPSESQTLQEMARMKGQQFPSVLPRELIGEVDKYLYIPQIINAIESAPNIAKALDNINQLSSDVLDKAGKKLGDMLKEKFKDQIDLAGSYGLTPLLIAAENGQKRKVKTLLAAGADINKADNYGQTPLLLAAKNGHIFIVEMLLAAGADINKVNEHGETPLFESVFYGHKKVVQKLLEARADKDKANNQGETPLFIAAYRGHEKIVHELLSKGADIDKATKDGDTPLFRAAYWGYEKIVHELLTAGANKSLGWQGITPYQIAAKKGHTAIIKMLEEN